MFLGYSPFIMYDLYVTNVEIEFYNFYLGDMTDNFSELGCIIPEYDPFDPSVTKYLSASIIIQCGQPQPYLTYLDSDGFIHFNQTNITSSGHEVNDYDCQYSEIFRTNNSDNEISFGILRIFKETAKLRSSAFVLVKCFLKSAGLVYENVHKYEPPPSPELYIVSRRKSNDVC